jgi:hypothetical protein
MTLALLDSKVLMAGLVALFLGVWIAIVVWFARSKATQAVKIAVFAVMALGSLGAMFVTVSFALMLPAHRNPTMGWVWVDDGLLVNPAGEQTFDFDVHEPGSLQVQALEQRGKKFDLRVLQAGQTLYEANAQAGSAQGTVAVGEGKATVSVRNDDAHEAKTVNLLVAQRKP